MTDNRERAKELRRTGMSIKSVGIALNVGTRRARRLLVEGGEVFSRAPIPDEVGNLIYKMYHFARVSMLNISKTTGVPQARVREEIEARGGIIRGPSTSGSYNDLRPICLRCEIILAEAPPGGLCPANIYNGEYENMPVCGYCLRGE